MKYEHGLGHGQRLLAQVFLFFGIVLVSGFLFSFNAPILVILFISWPFLLLFFNRPDYLLIMIICAVPSYLRFPGLGGSLHLYHLLILWFIAVVIARQVLLARGTAVPNPSHKWALLFIVILLVVMVVRGSGLQALGSDKWGGMRYASMILTACFMLLARKVQISSKQCRIALTAMCLLSILPFAAQLLYVLSGGKISQHFYFIVPFSTQGIEELAREGQTRWQAGNITSQYLTLLPFVAFAHPFRGSKKLLTPVILCAAFGIGMLSGHRLTIISNLLFLTLYGFFYFKGRRIGYIAMLAALATILLAITYTAAPYLPAPLQRALSWLPAISISSQAAGSAKSTITWRLLMWRYAIKEIPEYWLIGKGYAYSYSELYSAWRTGLYHQRWAIVQSAYHNGPLSLLIGTGVAGLIAGFGFLTAHIRSHFRLQRRKWSDSHLRRLHMVLVQWFITLAGVFAVLYGDAFVSLPPLFIMAGVMDVIATTDLTEKQEAESQAVDSGAV